MRTAQHKVFILTLALCMVFALLLTACGKSGGTPVGDDSTPGASAPTGTTDESNTPDTSEMPTKLEKPPKLDIPYGDEEWKAQIDNHIDLFNERAGIDVESVIDDAYKNYGQYMNEKINEDAIRVGIAGSAGSMYMSKSNVTGISSDALKKVNDFLASEDRKPLDITNPEQNLTAFLLAASLFYDPDITNGQPAYDIAMAFGNARADSSRPGHAESEADSYWSSYVSLFGGPFVLAEAMK